MKFCPKCGHLLVPKKIGNKVYLVCTACNYRRSAGREKIAIVSNIPSNKRHKIGVIEKGSRREISKEERESYQEEYYSVFLDTYAEEYEESEE